MSGDFVDKIVWTGRVGGFTLEKRESIGIRSDATQKKDISLSQAESHPIDFKIELLNLKAAHGSKPWIFKSYYLDQMMRRVYRK
jgi:hypothetical protein